MQHEMNDLSASRRKDLLAEARNASTDYAVFAPTVYPRCREAREVRIAADLYSVACVRNVELHVDSSSGDDVFVRADIEQRGTCNVDEIVGGEGGGGLGRLEVRSIDHT